MSLNFQNTEEPEDTQESLSSSSEEFESDEAEHEFSVTNYLKEVIDQILEFTSTDLIVAAQAQTSGLLNNKFKQVQDSHRILEQRMAEFKDNAANAIKMHKIIERNLEQITKRVAVLTRNAEKKYPIEYSEAKNKVYGI